MKLFIKDFFSKCDQIRRKLQIWSHLLKEIFNGKLHFCTVMCYKLLSYFCWLIGKLKENHMFEAAAHILEYYIKVNVESGA